MANPWDNDPIVSSAGGNPWDNDPIVESEGGPKPQGGDGKKRSPIPDWVGFGMRGNLAGGLIDFAGRVGYEGERSDAVERLKMAPTMMKQGRDIGLLDEREGFKAATGQGPVGRTFNAVVEQLPGGRIAQGVAGIAGEAFGDPGREYTEARDATRAEIAENRERFPGTSLAFEAIGGSGYNLPMVGRVGQGADDAAKGIFTAAKESAKPGAGVGAAYGFAEGEDNRIGSAIEGGLMGAALAGTLGAGAQSIANKVQTGKFTGANASDIIIDTAVEGLGVPQSSVKGLRQILSSSGYSRGDVDRGVVSIFDRLQRASQTGDRTGLFALELQKEFPAARQNIQDVFQQLATAPPKQGQTARIMRTGLDDQYGSQRTHFDKVAQDKLGTNSVDMEQKILARQRGEIGQTRDRVINYATTDARGRGVQNQMRAWWDEMSNDPEVAGSMRAAARQLGYKRTEAADEITQALNDNPARLLQKFGEVSGEAVRANQASPVLRQARQETEALFDELSRYGRQSENVAFAPKAEGPQGPYKQQQAKFRENYSQEEAIADARGRFQAARDPVKADEFVSWYNDLPSGEQSLVKTVIRQDMEKMLRGGNIDADGAYLTNLKKEGIHDVLKRVLGKDGEDISRAIVQLADEQQGLTALDPSKGLQARVVKPDSAAYRDAVDLYSSGIGGQISKLGNRLPAMGGYAGDIGLMASGQLPYLTMLRQGSKLFRPRAGTREGLAKLLTMREAGSIPPPSGKPVTRMDGTAPAAAALPRMTAPESPNASPAIQSAETRRLAAVQKAESAKQRAVMARQAQASEGEIRALEIEAAEAEAAAVLAERQAANARKITEEKVRQIAQTAKAKARATKRRGRAAVDRERAVGERQRAQTERFAEQDAGKMEAEAFGARTRAMEHEAAGKAIAQKYMEQQALESARQMQSAGVDPRQIYQETGIIPITVGGKSVLIRNSKQDYSKFMRGLQRDLRKGRDLVGAEGQVASRLGYAPLQEAAFAGSLPGMISKGERTMRNVFAAAAGGTGLALAGGAAYSKYDEGRQQRRSNAYRALEGDRDATKQIQNALKRAGYYDGRRDGRFDEEVINALVRFQKNNGHRNPGELDDKTLKALVQTLEDAGEAEAAEALKQLKP